MPRCIIEADIGEVQKTQSKFKLVTEDLLIVDESPMSLLNRKIISASLIA